MTTVTASITAQNTGTDYLRVPSGAEFAISVGTAGSGTTITLQRRIFGETTVYDVKTYNVSDEPQIGHSDFNWEFRLFVKTGDYGSGTIALDLWT